MRIALVHDYLKEYGGAEAVFETLTDLYPQADIFTSLYAPAYFGPHRTRLEKNGKTESTPLFLSLFPLLTSSFLPSVFSHP